MGESLELSDFGIDRLWTISLETFGTCLFYRWRADILIRLFLPVLVDSGTDPRVALLSRIFLKVGRSMPRGMKTLEKQALEYADGVAQNCERQKI